MAAEPVESKLNYTLRQVVSYPSTYFAKKRIIFDAEIQCDKPSATIKSMGQIICWSIAGSGVFTSAERPNRFEADIPYQKSAELANLLVYC